MNNKRIKKYQIFVSSTYRDLIEERKEATQAILECGCFPAGMELFPAVSQTQWELIKSVIDESDYYLVIIAGRYGSLGKDDEGKTIGFTEMEFDYALKTQKPIIAFVHNSIDTLPAKNVEKTKVQIDRLEKFIRKVCTDRLVKFWHNGSDLRSSIISSINYLKENNPSGGWIRVATVIVEMSEDEVVRQNNKDKEEKKNAEASELVQRFLMINSAVGAIAFFNGAMAKGAQNGTFGIVAQSDKFSEHVVRLLQDCGERKRAFLASLTAFIPYDKRLAVLGNETFFTFYLTLFDTENLDKNCISWALDFIPNRDASGLISLIPLMEVLSYSESTKNFDMLEILIRFVISSYETFRYKYQHGSSFREDIPKLLFRFLTELENKEVIKACIAFFTRHRGLDPKFVDMLFDNLLKGQSSFLAIIDLETICELIMSNLHGEHFGKLLSIFKSQEVDIAKALFAKISSVSEYVITEDDFYMLEMFKEICQIVYSWDDADSTCTLFSYCFVEKTYSYSPIFTSEELIEVSLSFPDGVIHKIIHEIRWKATDHNEFDDLELAKIFCEEMLNKSKMSQANKDRLQRVISNFKMW